MKKILTCLLVCCCFTGCQSGKSFDWSNFGKNLVQAPEKKPVATKKKESSFSLASLSKPAKKKKAEGPQMPTQIVAIWKQAVLSSPVGPIRGFAGRLYFHDRLQNPCKVNGELIVYAFNDKGKPPFKETAAIKKFIFRPQDLVKQHSVSELGDSYSVWIPFDKIGGPDQPIALMPVFRDAKTGRMIQGKQGVCTLHGSVNASNVKTQPKHYQFNPISGNQVPKRRVSSTEVTQVSYQAPHSSANEEKRTETRTFSIPNNATAIKDSTKNASFNNASETDLARKVREALAARRAREQAARNNLPPTTQASTHPNYAPQNISTQQTGLQPQRNFQRSQKSTQLNQQGTTSRWDNAVNQFLGSRRPNSMGNGF